MHNIHRFTIGTEGTLATLFEDIDAFYTNVLYHHKVHISDNVFLSAIELIPQSNTIGIDEVDGSNTLVIIAGRAETEHKYAELLYNLQHANLRVIVCFVRGQGQSSPVLINNNKCHVEDFNDYINDIASILSYLKVGPNYRLMGFSLGGLIALSFCFYGKYMYKPKALALLAPFLGTKFPVKDSVLLPCIKFLCKFPAIATSFTPHGAEYKRISFDDNVHSHSLLRYESYHDYYANHPDLPLAGPTFQFVRECLKMQSKLNHDDIKFNFPAICICSGDDAIVDSNAACEFFKKHQLDPIKPTIETVPNAYHDLLNEVDAYRDASLLRALHFLFD